MLELLHTIHIWKIYTIGGKVYSVLAASAVAEPPSVRPNSWGWSRKRTLPRIGSYFMANPQKENGYTPIANEILDAIMRTPLTAGEHRTLDAIIRKTYGYNKKEDILSFSQIAGMIGMSRRTVMLAVQNLEVKKIITVIRKHYSPSTIRFNKDHESWVVNNTSPQIKRRRMAVKLYGGNLFTSEQVSSKVVNSPAKSSELAVHPQKTQKTTKEIIQAEESTPLPVFDFMLKFETLDPFYRSAMTDPKEVQASVRLLEQQPSLVWWDGFLAWYVPEKKRNKYIAKATRPVGLERRMGDILATYEEQKNKPKSKVIIV